MTDNADLPAKVRKQDEEAELQIAAQLAELRKDTEESGTQEVTQSEPGRPRAAACDQGPR